jgi:hypothetical protein
LRTASREERQAWRQPTTPKRDPIPGSNTEKMTGAQASYLKTLCEEAGEEFDPNLTKAEASRRIDQLKANTGRGA